MSIKHQDRYESLALFALLMKCMGVLALLLSGLGLLLIFVAVFATHKDPDRHIVYMQGGGLVVTGLAGAVIYFAASALLHAIRDMAINSHRQADALELANELLTLQTPGRQVPKQRRTVDDADDDKPISIPGIEPDSEDDVARLSSYEVFGKLSNGQMKTYQSMARNEEEARDIAFSDGFIEVHNIRRL